MAEINGVAWHIMPQGQRLTTQLTSTGAGFTDVWEVTYHIDSGPAQGTSGQVRIPASQYTPEVVEATISAQVAKQDSIASL